MRRRTLGAVLVLVTMSPASGTVHRVAAHPSGRRSSHTDRELGDEVDRVLAHRIENGRNPLVPVEVLTADNTSIEHEVNDLGGTVTGSVDGQLVQAIMPAGVVDELSTADAARYVRRPLRVNRLPRIERAGLGAVVGEEVTLTNASAWHAAGITGKVRVGIIDFFDLTKWNESEHGVVPDAAHQFCRGEGLCTATGQIVPAVGDPHGVAVAEIVKDMAPDAELFLATTETTAETQAAIDWFVANGVHIVTRSLGAPYDGPGDGTGPLDAVVDYAAARGITWFNSAGNDAAFGYGRYTYGVDSNGYVDFASGPEVDTMLRIDPEAGAVAFDGIRWANDWYLPSARVTDYSVEVRMGFSETSSTLVTVLNDSQVGGAPPLEAVDFAISDVGAGQAVYLRIHADAHYSRSVPDTIEVATFVGMIAADRRSTAYSAAKPVVDSRNPSLVAVGAIDPANGSGGIASYSSQGPTNDGRVKPDVTAPSCVTSTIYTASPPCFNGTSAASPAAAGMAALLLDRGLAEPGMPLAALTKHLVHDLGPPGPDDAYGAGEILLPAPPPLPLTPSQVTPSPATPPLASTFTALPTPARLLDTRPESLVGPATLAGPHPQFDIVDLPISLSGVIPAAATAVAVNITSTDSANPFYVQALPTLGSAIGAFSTINVAAPGQIRSNFAIVPLGSQGSISIFIPNGGNLIVDVMGYFTPLPATATSATAGRFVPLNPHRVLDTRPTEPGPVPSGWVAHKPAASEPVRVDVPATADVPATGVSALVVNITATEPAGAGYLQAIPTGSAAGRTSNVNYVKGQNAATLAIVPLGADGTISVFTSNSSHIVVDLMGYITDDTAPPSTAGLFVAVAPDRYYDSRSAPHSVHTDGSTIAVLLAGAPFAIPVGAAAVSINLTSDQATGTGFVTTYPADGPFPLASNLNFVAATAVANAGLVKLSANGALNTFVNVATHVIIDVNGYFTGTQ